VVVCFVDIDGIVDHHCLNFLFIVNFLQGRSQLDIFEDVFFTACYIGLI